MVSHDKHLLTNTCDEFWVIGNQTLTSFANFDKATRFCYKKCKPVDVLPREFSTVEVKGRKDIGKRAKAVDPANILQGDMKKKKEDDDGLFIIDVGRILMRSIDKDLKPEKFLVHLKVLFLIHACPTLNVLILEQENCENEKVPQKGFFPSYP